MWFSIYYFFNVLYAEVLDIVSSLADGSFECDFNSTSGILAHYDNVLSEIRIGISELL